jgi:hypothetical protein
MKVIPWWQGITPSAYHVDDDDTVTLTSFSTFWPLDSSEFLVHLLSQELAEFPLKILGTDFTNPICRYDDHTQFSTEISYVLWPLKDNCKARMSVFMVATNLETAGRS